jgi:hypothetical protein
VRIAFATDPFDAVPTWTIITQDVISMHIKRGRQYELDRFEAGTATLILKNIHGFYWPDNSSSPYHDNLDIGKRVNIRATYGATTYDLYTGFVEWWKPSWLSSSGGLIPVMQVHCADLLALLSRKKLNDAGGYAEELSGTRIDNVLDTLGWLGGSDLDAGQQSMQATGALANVNAMSHIQKVCESELSLFYIAGDGDAQYEDRSHRTAAPHTVSQATLTDTMTDVEFVLDDKLLYNDVRSTRTGGTEQVATDSTSQRAYGPRTLEASGLLLTDDVPARNRSYYLLARLATPVMRARSITIKPEKQPAYFWPKALGFEISTRITVTLSQGSISADYFIEGTEHDYDARRGEWTTKWQLSNADRYLYSPDAVEDIIRPNAAGDETAIPVQYPAADSHYDKVDEATADDDTTYVENDTDDEKRDLYNLAAAPYTSGTINSVTVHCRLKQTATGIAQGYGKPSVRTGGASYDGTQTNLSGTGYQNISATWALNPNTGVAWTWADIAALQAGCLTQNPLTAGFHTGHVRLTQVWVVINYTPSW